MDLDRQAQARDPDGVQAWVPGVDAWVDLDSVQSVPAYVRNAGGKSRTSAGVPAHS